MVALDETAVTELAEAFSGRVLLPAVDGYEEARRVHNGLIDRRPALIARCANTADVVDAVNFARAHSLEITVRGGGHNVGGRAVADDALMIDLSLMRGIDVSPTDRIARAQPGLTWRDFNRATQLHGLAVTGGVISSTGIAGLTLGGGLGWLMGTLGMAVDNLVGAEIVMADGQVLRANATEHSDLFWALRGGSGNFGVVTSFEFALHPVGPMVTGGVMAYPLESAVEVLRFFRGFTSDLPDELGVVSALTHAPDGSGLPIAVIAACHVGSMEQAETDLRPLREFGSPIVAGLGPVPYSALNSALDAGFPKGARNYWKANFLRELPDEAIDTMVEQFAICPSPMSAVLLEHFHGAVTRLPVEATAYAQRAIANNFLVASQWMDGDDQAHIDWARETYARMEPFMAEGRYVNYLGADEGGDQVARAYGPNFARLAAVKAKYDPENLFHHNANIRPV